MATCSSFLAWRIPWTEEPGKLQSMESQRVVHALVTEHMSHITVFLQNILARQESGLSEKTKTLF